jgi:tRNA pseudouridine38-40 synthase
VRYRARVEYDGTDFHGFQLQPGGRTVQGELERALARISAGSRVRIEGAGRTDAGVHARGQVVAFTYAGRLGRRRLTESLRALLPADVTVGPLQRVPMGFRPRQQAVYREYRYTIWNGPPSPLRERYALGVREDLDTAAMAAAAEVLVGRHDFSGFGHGVRQPMRTLHRVRVRRVGRTITIQVIGDSFLRHMVRRLVAGLLRVAQGQATTDELAAALRSEEPAFAGQTAPAHGLCLWRVAYGTARTEEWIQDD